MVAGASIIVLIATGMLEYLFIWCSHPPIMCMREAAACVFVRVSKDPTNTVFRIALFGFIGMLASCLALYGLGNKPPRCLLRPRAPERMHKVALRCSCHLGWILGATVLFFSALVLTKFQVISICCWSVMMPVLSSVHISHVGVTSVHWWRLLNLDPLALGPRDCGGARYPLHSWDHCGPRTHLQCYDPLAIARRET